MVLIGTIFFCVAVSISGILTDIKGELYHIQSDLFVCEIYTSLVNEAWICIKFVVQTVFILHPGTMKDLEKMEVLAKKVAEKSNMKKTSAEELLYDIKVLCFMYYYIY